MDKKRRRAIVALFLILSIGNFFRLEGHETIRLVLFLTIFAIGILSGVLISDLSHLFRSKKEDKDKMV